VNPLVEVIPLDIPVERSEGITHALLFVSAYAEDE
jgi:hypothetical protein